MMKRIDTKLPGVCVLEPLVQRDNRGYFLESYNYKTFVELGIGHTFVQDNYSCSGQGVLRGLHYQLKRPQAKLVRVTVGEVFDVAVDIRPGSETFGQWVGVVLAAESKRMLFVPEGFAHGFYVMTETAEFAYKCSDYYSPADERGVIWNDPDIAILWPTAGREPIVSVRDRAFGTLLAQPKEDLPGY